MAQQTLNLGAAANDHTGDDLRTGSDKVNQNFNELYGRWGANNTRNDDYSVTLGTENTATGDRSAVLGGQGSTAAGHRSVVLGGQEAYTRLYGELGFASGKIAAIGDAQAGEFVMRCQTTDATATRLTATGQAPWTDNTVNLTDRMVMAGDLTVISKRAGTADAAVWRIPVSIVRNSGVASTSVFQGAGSAVAPGASNGVGSAWRLTVEADTTYGGLAVTFTGTASQTVNSVARFSFVQTFTAS